MDRAERWTAILELLGRDGKLDVEAAAAKLHVSTATIRRDFDALGGQQMLTRTRGGAVSHSVSYGLPLRYRTAHRHEDKLRIASAVAALLEPGTVVGLNGGTTTTEVARAIASRQDLADAGNRAAITVVTNALNIASELAVRPYVKIVVTGGVARPQSFELIGPMAEQALRDLSLDVAVIGVDGFDPEYGATAGHEGEAYVNRLLAERARTVVVVADSSKVGVRAFSRICGVQEVSRVVTDAAVDAALVQRLDHLGIEVLRV
ncbi:MAG: DeoR/GlpR family DNA-binding transcription regulator [Streptosporangiales bacterium]